MFHHYVWFYVDICGTNANSLAVFPLDICYIVFRATTKNAVMSRLNSYLTEAADEIRNVNDRYYAAVNPHWTILPLLERVVGGNRKKLTEFCFNFHARTCINGILKTLLNIFCIFGSGH